MSDSITPTNYYRVNCLKLCALVKKRKQKIYNHTYKKPHMLHLSLGLIITLWFDEKKIELRLACLRSILLELRMTIEKCPSVCVSLSGCVLRLLPLS